MRVMTNRSSCQVHAALALLLLMASLVSCKKADESTGPTGPIGDVKVTQITLGRILAPDGTITEESKTNSYWINDTFYVSVETDGTGDDINVEARWTGPDGKVAAKDSQKINPRGKTITALQASPPPTLWAVGDYKVEILLNGHPQGTKDLLART